MRKSVFAITILVTLACSASAWAVVSTVTLKDPKTSEPLKSQTVTLEVKEPEKKTTEKKTERQEEESQKITEHKTQQREESRRGAETPAPLRRTVLRKKTKTDNDGVVTLTYDEKKVSSDATVDITIHTDDGRVLRRRGVVLADFHGTIELQDDTPARFASPERVRTSVPTEVRRSAVGRHRVNEPAQAESAAGAPAYNWTGFYIGGHAGGAWANNHWTDLEGSPITSNSPSGFLGGAQIGFNYQSGFWIIGVEVSGSGAHLTSSSDCFDVLTCESKISWLLAVQGRLGVAVAPTAVVYATGGAAWVGDEFNFHSDELSGSTTATRAGGGVGGGLNFALYREVWVFVEYDHYWFGDHQMDLVASNQDSRLSVNVRQDVDVVKAGLNVRFASDVRLKRDLVRLRTLDNGIGIYRFRYFWSDELYVGVMAQEVSKVIPEAVTEAPDGYLRVDYTRLGLQFTTWNQWLAKQGDETHTLGPASLASRDSPNLATVP
jgi:outer membrane immunogenic protein